MSKYVVIAMLAIVPTAFAATVMPSPAETPAGFNPVAGATFSFDVLLNTESSPVTGFAYMVRTDAEGAGKIQLTSVVRPAAGSVGWDSWTVGSPGQRTLTTAVSGQDLGGTVPDAVTPIQAGITNQATLNFTLLADVPVGTKIYLTDVKWSDPDFNDHKMGDASFFTITPEPASMLLVAAGAAFFARRRRA